MMGGHWVDCEDCGHITRFPSDFMWFDAEGKLHDIEKWVCGNCKKTMKEAEERPNIFLLWRKQE